MKRTIEIQGTDGEVTVKIKATITTRHTTTGYLTRDEVERIRRTLGDRIMDSVPDLPYLGIHLVDLKVK